MPIICFRCGISCSSFKMLKMHVYRQLHQVTFAQYTRSHSSNRGRGIARGSVRTSSPSPKAGPSTPRDDRLPERNSANLKSPSPVPTKSASSASGERTGHGLDTGGDGPRTPLSSSRAASSPSLTPTSSRSSESNSSQKPMSRKQRKRLRVKQLKKFRNPSPNVPPCKGKTDPKKEASKEEVSKIAGTTEEIARGSGTSSSKIQQPFVTTLSESPKDLKVAAGRCGPDQKKSDQSEGDASGSLCPNLNDTSIEITTSELDSLINNVSPESVVMLDSPDTLHGVQNPVDIQKPCSGVSNTDRSEPGGAGRAQSLVSLHDRLPLPPPILPTRRFSKLKALIAAARRTSPQERRANGANQNPSFVSFEESSGPASDVIPLTLPAQSAQEEPSSAIEGEELQRATPGSSGTVKLNTDASILKDAQEVLSSADTITDIMESIREKAAKTTIGLARAEVVDVEDDDEVVFLPQTNLPLPRILSYDSLGLFDQGPTRAGSTHSVTAEADSLQASVIKIDVPAVKIKVNEWLEHFVPVPLTLPSNEQRRSRNVSSSSLELQKDVATEPCLQSRSLESKNGSSEHLVHQSFRGFIVPDPNKALLDERSLTAALRLEDRPQERDDLVRQPSPGQNKSKTGDDISGLRGGEMRGMLDPLQLNGERGANQERCHSGGVSLPNVGLGPEQLVEEAEYVASSSAEEEELIEFETEKLKALLEKHPFIQEKYKNFEKLNSLESVRKAVEDVMASISSHSKAQKADLSATEDVTPTAPFLRPVSLPDQSPTVPFSMALSVATNDDFPYNIEGILASTEDSQPGFHLDTAATFLHLPPVKSPSPDPVACNLRKSLARILSSPLHAAPPPGIEAQRSSFLIPVPMDIGSDCEFSDHETEELSVEERLFAKEAEAQLQPPAVKTVETAVQPVKPVLEPSGSSNEKIKLVQERRYEEAGLKIKKKTWQESEKSKSETQPAKKVGAIQLYPPPPKQRIAHAAKVKQSEASQKSGPHKRVEELRPSADAQRTQSPSKVAGGVSSPQHSPRAEAEIPKSSKYIAKTRGEAEGPMPLQPKHRGVIHDIRERFRSTVLGSRSPCKSPKGEVCKDSKKPGAKPSLRPEDDERRPVGKTYEKSTKDRRDDEKKKTSLKRTDSASSGDLRISERKRAELREVESTSSVDSDNEKKKHFRRTDSNSSIGSTTECKKVDSNPTSVPTEPSKAKGKKTTPSTTECITSKEPDSMSLSPISVPTEPSKPKGKKTAPSTTELTTSKEPDLMSPSPVSVPTEPSKAKGKKAIPCTTDSSKEPDTNKKKHSDESGDRKGKERKNGQTDSKKKEKVAKEDDVETTVKKLSDEPVRKSNRRKKNQGDEEKEPPTKKKKRSRNSKENVPVPVEETEIEMQQQAEHSDKQANLAPERLLEEMHKEKSPTSPKRLSLVDLAVRVTLVDSSTDYRNESYDKAIEVPPGKKAVVWLNPETSQSSNFPLLARNQIQNDEPNETAVRKSPTVPETPGGDTPEPRSDVPELPISETTVQSLPKRQKPRPLSKYKSAAVRAAKAMRKPKLCPLSKSDLNSDDELFDEKYDGRIFMEYGTDECSNCGEVVCSFLHCSPDMNTVYFLCKSCNKVIVVRKPDVWPPTEILHSVK